MIGTPSEGRSERGSVSIVAAAIMTIVAVMTLATADLAQVLVASGRAQAAADSAALAAAQELALPRSGSSPAQVATEYAVRNGGTLIECRCEIGSVEATVIAEVETGPLLLLLGERHVQARARAVVGTDLSGTDPG